MAETGLAAFLTDTGSRRLVAEVDVRAKVERGSLRDAVRAYRKRPSPDVLLVDLDGERVAMAHIPELFRVCRPQSVVLATGSENNVVLANELYRAGVFLYLPKPLDAAGLRSTIAEILALSVEEARPEVQASRLVLVLGRGSGATTLAALLAHLAAEEGRYVTGLDLDPDFGTLALALDTEPRRGLVTILQSGADEGHDFVDQLQAQVSPRISLVAHPADQTGNADFTEAGLARLVEALATRAHMIVTTGATPAHVQALRRFTNHHLVVFEPTPAGISVAVRWLRLLDGARSTLVLNHTRPLPGLVARDQIRKALGERDPDIELPYLRRMARAMALGEPESALSRHERKLLHQFLHPLLGTGAREE